MFTPPGSPARLLPLLYALSAFPVVLVLVFATPPFQVADEGNHFLRATQIAGGRFIAQRLSDADAGGFVDAQAIHASTAFDGLKFQPQNKLDIGLYGEIAALHWGEMDKTAASFPNTAIYPPFFYIPAAVGIRLGKMGHRSILDTLYLARLANALCAVAMAALAIALCARGRAVMVLVLSFPMVLSLFGSVSQDALSIASGALGIAIWSRYLDRDEEVPFGARCCAALLIGAIVAARLPLLPLYGLLLLPTSSARGLFSRTWLSRTDVISIGVGLLPIAIGVYGAHAAKIPFRANDGVSPSGQVAFLLHDPKHILEVAAATLRDSGLRYLREMVGVLGWLDTPMPVAYYAWIATWFAVALGVESVAAGRSFRGAGCWLLLAAIMAASAGVFAALYLAWTPVGTPIVDGVQGRYLIVPVLFVVAVLPTLARPRLKAHPAIVPWARLALCGIVGTVNLWVVPTTILARYYG